MTDTSEAKKRDYSHEYQIRHKKKKRFIGELEREKANEFEALLRAKQITFSQWLTIQIDKEMTGPK